MKIYFSSSVRGGRRDAPLYFKIVELLKALGHEVTTECLNNFSQASNGDVPDAEIHERDCRWIRESELLIAEVTQTSLGVGYQTAYAESLGKRVICLYRPREGAQLSAIINGNKRFAVVEYQKVEELREVLPGVIEGVAAGR